MRAGLGKLTHDLAYIPIGKGELLRPPHGRYPERYGVSFDRMCVIKAFFGCIVEVTEIGGHSGSLLCQ